MTNKQRSEPGRRELQPRLSGTIGLGAIVLAMIGAMSSASIAAAAPENHLPQKIDAEARHVLEHLTKTSFSHKGTIDAAKGVFTTDSSGLVDYVIEKVSSSLFGRIKISGKESRPWPRDYYVAFRAAPATRDAAAAQNGGVGGWQHIFKMSEARPGDVIAFNVLSESGKDEGHVLIVDASPKLEPRQMQTKTEKVRDRRGRTEDKQVQVPGPDVHRMYRVEVIDSALKPHADDSRSAGGVGRGAVWIDVNTEGEPIGIHWSSALAKPQDQSIAIGRAVEGKSKSPYKQ